MKTPQEKYAQDNHYKMLVDHMVKMIMDCQFTPSELREAAIFASILYEQHNIRQHQYHVPSDVDKAFDTLCRWTKETQILFPHTKKNNPH